MNRIATRSEQPHIVPAQIAGNNRAHAIDLSNQSNGELFPAICAPTSVPTFDSFLSERIDWLNITIERELERPSRHSAARLRFLRAMKAELEGQI